jgi:uncharacterized repeat protein (TIGR01451 family)
MLTGVTWTCAGTGGGTCIAAGNGNINTAVTVPVGASVVFTATGVVNPAATGELVNSAQVVPPAGLVNRTSAIATDHDAIDTEADVAITKTGPASIVAGNPIVYTITVTNTGPSDAANVVVRDPTPAGLTWVSNAGDCTTAVPLHARRRAGRGHSHDHRDLQRPARLQRRVADRERDRCVCDDGGHEHGEQHGDRRDDAESQCGRGDQQECSPVSVLVGQPTTFTVVVTNHGPARVTGLVVQDLLPAGLSLVLASASQGSYAEATGAWTIGTLLNAQSATLTLDATVTVAGAITNRALVVARDQPDPVASNNSAAAVVNGTANADVGVHTTVDQPAPSVGDTVTFTVTVVNTGPSAATGVVVTDALPAGLTLVSPTPSQGTYTAPTWSVGTLSETGTPATLTLVATVTAPGALVQTATVTQQTEVDPNPANNSASVTLNAAESANLTVTKSLTRASPHVGELLTFNVIVANQGPSPATGVQVTEVLSAGSRSSRQPCRRARTTARRASGRSDRLRNGGSAGLSITARVTQAGTVTNTASVTASDQPDPDPADDTASVTLTTETIADLAITKTLTGSTVPGRTTTYTIVVTNLGPSPVTAASVSDCFRPRSSRRRGPAPRTPDRAAPRLGHGNLATTVTLEAGDRATFTVTGLIAANATGPARQHGDRHGAGRRRRSHYYQQHGGQFGNADALRRSADHQGGSGHRRARDECGLHDHRHKRRAVGCDRRHAHRPDSRRPDVRVERRGLHDGLPVQPRHPAARGDPHDHGDLRGPVRLYDAESDRQHGDGDECDAAGGASERDHQYAGRRAGDGSAHYQDQWCQRRGRG